MKRSFFFMRALQKITAALVILGLPLAFASGCAPAGSGSGFAPAGSAALNARGAAPALMDPQTTAGSAQWLQFGYDAGHTGYNPVEQTINAGNVSNLHIVWNHQTLIQPGGIVVDGGVAYVEDMGQSNAGLYAYNAANGAKKWYADVNLNGPWGSFNHATPVVSGDVVVSPCSNGSSSKFLTGLCGLNAKTGKSVWTYYCSQYQGGGCGGLVNGTSPALYKNLVYAQITQGVNEQPDTEALNSQTGKVVWDVPGVYHCPDAGLTNNSPLPIEDGLVYAVLGCQGQKGATELCAFSSTNGHAAWCDDTADVYVHDVIAGNGYVYMSEDIASNEVILALDAKSGARAWSATLPGSNYSTLATAANHVFVEDGGAGVFALSTKNGKKQWSYTSNGNLIQAGVISVANGLVYTDGGGGNNGNVAITAFNEKNGHVVWTSGSIGNGGAPATPVIVDGTIYAGCYTMCAFKPSTKKSAGE
jgi:hypothetical protein